MKLIMKQPWSFCLTKDTDVWMNGPGAARYANCKMVQSAEIWIIYQNNLLLLKVLRKSKLAGSPVYKR